MANGQWPCSDVEFVKCYTKARFPISKCSQRKSINRDIFGKKLRMEDALVVYFEQIEQIVSFYTQIQNPGNLHRKGIFRVT